MSAEVKLDADRNAVMIGDDFHELWFTRHELPLLIADLINASSELRKQRAEYIKGRIGELETELEGIKE